MASHLPGIIREDSSAAVRWSDSALHQGPATFPEKAAVAPRPIDRDASQFDAHLFKEGRLIGSSFQSGRQFMPRAAIQFPAGPLDESATPLH